jgi:hypothetical protein
MDSEGLPERAAPTRTYGCGTGSNRVTLSVDDELLRIDVRGDALEEGIVDCFRNALAEGAIRPNMLSLIDLSDFSGRFEWSTIHAIVQLAPWGSEPGRASKVAYVTKSAWFSAMIKVTSVLFPHSQHRQFSSVHRALQWLQSHKRAERAAADKQRFL